MSDPLVGVVLLVCPEGAICCGWRTGPAALPAACCLCLRWFAPALGCLPNMMSRGSEQVKDEHGPVAFGTEGAVSGERR